MNYHAGKEIQSHTPFHSPVRIGHEIQRQQIVSASRNTEAVVIRLRDLKGRLPGERATVKSPVSQERQVRQQQPPQRQCEQQAEQPSRNDSEFQIWRF